MLYLVLQNENRTREEVDARFTQETSALRSALAGALELVLEADAVEIDAALLNGAVAGTLQDTFLVRLQTPVMGLLHTWCNLVPVVGTAEVCTDDDIDAPTVVGEPAFNQGVLEVRITFDTDEGDTKVYEADDEITVEIQVSAADTLLGFEVAPVTRTYTVVSA